MQFRELRAMLQAPRKTADTWYGKWVMRRISIYITWAFSLLGLRPNHVTFLSLVFALIGIKNLMWSNLAIGILGLNLWYLFDHVDGEIARLRKETSLSGTFFDTVINFLVQPFTFLGLAVGLVPQTGWGTLYWGFVAAMGSLMLLAIPMTEESILFNESTKQKFVYQKMGAVSSLEIQGQNLFRKSYRFTHTLVTYPYVLFLMTFGYLVLLFLNRDFLRQSVFFYRFLIVYAFVVTLIWVSQLFYKVYFRTLDRFWKSESGT